MTKIITIIILLFLQQQIFHTMSCLDVCDDYVSELGLGWIQPTSCVAHPAWSVVSHGQRPLTPSAVRTGSQRALSSSLSHWCNVSCRAQSMHSLGLLPS